MKAIKAVDNRAVLADVPEPGGEGVKIKIVSSSICGSDLHMLERGYLVDRVIGHEFAGYTPDGTAVAVEPNIGCGQCAPCGEGYNSHCEAGLQLMGVMSDGGMAEYACVPERNLVPLPSGLDISAGSLVEPLAVAIHGLDRVRVRDSDRVLVIGAGPIGLATAAALQARNIPYAISARHEHQRLVAEQLGASFDLEGSFDVVIDAVGTSHSLDESVFKLKPMGRIGMVGSFWDPTTLNPAFCMKEIELIASATYVCKAPNRNFEEAGRVLAERPELPGLLVTHRFPLDAVDEAFAAAADRAAGAIKVVFDV